MKRLRLIFYIVYALYCIILLFLCIKLMQVPDATEDAFYLYLKKTFGGYFGVIDFLETYFRSFQIFTVFAVILSFFVLFYDLLGKALLRRKIGKLEAEVGALKAKLYDKNSTPTPPKPDAENPGTGPEK